MPGQMRGPFKQVPEDTGLYVTEEIQKVRASAAQRERTKAAGLREDAVPKAKARHAQHK